MRVVASANAFTKTLTCPSSQDISSRRLPRGKSDQIARHIAGCDFCAAEQSFLSAYIQPSEEYKPAEMPAHLRHLAEALLIGKLGKGKLGKAERFLQGSDIGAPLTRTGFRV